MLDLCVVKLKRNGIEHVKKVSKDCKSCNVLRYVYPILFAVFQHQVLQVISID